MTKYILPILVSLVLILTGCSQSEVNTKKIDTIKKEKFNDLDVQQSTPIEIEKLKSENQKLLQENKELEKQVGHFQEKSMLMSKPEVIELLKSINNENPIFNSENLLRDNKKFALINSDSEPIYDQLKIFLKRINLEELYNLESVAGNRKLMKNNCEKIISEYKEKTKKDIDWGICDRSFNDDNTYKHGDPLSVYVHQIENKYFYINILKEGLGGINFFNIVYDIKNQKIIDLTDRLENINLAFYLNSILWFKEFNKLVFSYNLETNKLNDYSEDFHNKSHKWWIINTKQEFIVKSFDGAKTINLGKLTNKNQDSFFEHLKSGTYFETNTADSKFVLLDSVSCEKNNSCLATVRYGDLEENGLQGSKTFEVKYQPFETMCWESANRALFLKDNLIITTTGCPSILELTVFDTENEKFLYRHNSVERDYFNENLKEEK